MAVDCHNLSLPPRKSPRHRRITGRLHSRGVSFNLSSRRLQACPCGLHVSVRRAIRRRLGNGSLPNDYKKLFRGRLTSFSIERWTGKKCIMLAARDLTIVWGDTPRYWRWISLPESRFSEVAELLDVCWLEVRGKIKASMLSPNTTYSVFLVFTTKSGTHGFEYHAAEGSVGISGQESETRTVCLDPDGAKRYMYQIVPRRMGFFNRHFGNIMREEEPSSPLDGNTEFPKQRDSIWNEVLLGEFYIKDGQDCELEVGLMEVKAGNWKSGLIIEGIEIRPKANTRG